MRSLHHFLLADIGSEKYLKKLAGRTDLEDGLKKLDKLTQEQTRMAAAQLLILTHSADNILTAGDNVKAIKSEVWIGNDELTAVVEEVQEIIGVVKGMPSQPTHDNDLYAIM